MQWASILCISGSIHQYYQRRPDGPVGHRTQPLPQLLAVLIIRLEFIPGETVTLLS